MRAITEMSKFISSHHRLLARPTIRSFSISSSSRSDFDLKSYKAVNEPILDYARNSQERAQIEQKLNEFLENASKIRNDQREALFDVPIVIGDKEVNLSSY